MTDECRSSLPTAVEKRCTTHNQPARGAVDPNEKVTIAKSFIQPDQLLVYPIHFENIGTAEARDVFVTDALDTNLDASTLNLLTPTGGSFDLATRTVKWDLLNINLEPGETGNVLLSIRPRHGLPSGTAIRNRATIQFEVFQPFVTNEVVNIIDSTRPASVVAPLPPVTSTPDFQISWSGSDAVGEIDHYTILVSVNGGAFTPFLERTRETSAIFRGESGKTYGFLSIATDTAGNIEVQSATPEATTRVVVCAYSLSPTSQTFPPSGGIGGVGVFTAAECAWTAASTVPWITLISAASGSGNGSVSYTVGANPLSTQRTGTITIADQTFTVTQAANFGGLQYYPLPFPVRLLDTRPDPVFPSCVPSSDPLTGGSVFTLPVVGNCNGLAIPASAKAVVGNATVVNFQSSGGFITLFPSDAAQPNASNLNFTANHIVPNSFTVGLGSDGALKIFTSASTHFIIDITGYYAPPGAGGLYFHPLPAPVRLLDTRPDPFTSCFASSTPLVGGGTMTLPAVGNCSGATIPASAKALVGNATVVNFQSGGGFITLFPSDATLPNASNLNFTTDHIVPNSFVVGLSASGSFNIFTSASTNFIVDIAGYFSDQAVDENGQGLLFYPLSAPARWLDTRPDPFVSCIPSNTPLGAGSIFTLQAQMSCEGQTVPASAKSVLGNATVVNFQSGGGFVTLFPSDATLPNASNLNFTSNHIVPNSFVVGLSPDGAFKIFTSAATHFIVDLSGYFAP